MKTPLRTLGLLMTAALSAAPVFARDVFDEADALRQALLDRDIAHLKTLDGTGQLLGDDTLKFLFDAGWMGRMAPGMRPLRDIVAEATSPPLIEKHLVDGQPVYHVYWFAPLAGGSVVLQADQWMKAVAVCALTEDPKGGWSFYRHVCFDETEGPFSSGNGR